MVVELCFFNIIEVDAKLNWDFARDYMMESVRQIHRMVYGVSMVISDGDSHIERVS